MTFHRKHADNSVVSCLLSELKVQGMGFFLFFIKVKVSPLHAMKAHGGRGNKGPHMHVPCTRKR